MLLNAGRALSEALIAHIRSWNKVEMNGIFIVRRIIKKLRCIFCNEWKCGEKQFLYSHHDSLISMIQFSLLFLLFLYICNYLYQLYFVDCTFAISFSFINYCLNRKNGGSYHSWCWEKGIKETFVFSSFLTILWKTWKWQHRI